MKEQEPEVLGPLSLRFPDSLVSSGGVGERAQRLSFRGVFASGIGPSPLAPGPLCAVRSLNVYRSRSAVGRIDGLLSHS